MSEFGRLLKDRTFYGPLALSLLVFAVMGVFSLSHIPERSYFDAQHHRAYAEIVAREHRLPRAFEGLESVQPPLFYMLAAGCQINSENHGTIVRFFSWTCGAVFLFLLAFALAQTKADFFERTALLCFTCTKPLYVVLFTAYNNDGLAALFNGCAVVSAYLLYKRPSKSLSAVFLVVAACALYTKLSALVTITCLCAISLGLLTTPKRRSAISLLALSFFAALSLVPWYATVFYASGHLAPANFAGREIYQLSRAEGPLKFVLMPPFVALKEWTTPYGVILLKRSFLSVYIATSVFVGHWPGWSPFTVFCDIFAWIAFAITMLTIVAAASVIFLDGWTKSAGALIGLAIFLHGCSVYFADMWSVADFRYSAWSWLVWIYLLGCFFAWSRSRSKRLRSGRMLLLSLLLVGTAAQVIFVTNSYTGLQSLR